MSVISGRSSLASMVQNSLNHQTSLAKVKYSIRPKQVEVALKELLHNNSPRAYEELVCTLRDCTVKDEDLCLVLGECCSCMSLLGREARLLVEALCKLEWASRSPATVDLFSRWLLNLLTAQIYHAPMAIGYLVKSLKNSEVIWCDSPSEQQTETFTNVHKLIAKVVAIIPMSGEVLLHCIIDNYPYYKHSTCINQAYVYNLLWITRYLPNLTDHVVTLILSRLIVIDVNIKRSVDEPELMDDNEIFEMDDSKKESDQLTECIDLCMLELFKWLYQEGQGALDILFSVFEHTILPTHSTRYIQFLMFYGLSLDANRVNGVLESLWQLVASAKVGPSLRQASVTHLAGVLARGNFISLLQIQLYIKKMADWCHSYIKAQDTYNPPNGNNPHNVFYFVCQSLFYLIAFKHNQMFSAKKGLIFLESLNLSKIVMCPLNPLRMCQSAVAEAFASITRIHQVVYCHTVMEHNERHYLRVDEDATKGQEWFPYDPFTLPRSYDWIKGLYCEYEDTVKDVTFNKFYEAACDEDDFLATSPIIERSNSMSYSLKSFRQL